MQANNKLKLYKYLSILGIVLLGIGSFIACLSFDKTISNIGSALMIIGIVVSWYSFKYWTP